MCKNTLLAFVLCLVLPDALGNLFLRTLLSEELQTSGAMCLDGSAPGYYLSAGSGDGTNKWILELGDGGWCSDTASCFEHSLTGYGSTANEIYYPPSAVLVGILGSDSVVNPDFYNWNRVYIISCDGGMFAGDRNEPEMFNDTALYFRGYHNLKAVIRHLNNDKGMSSATDVLLMGCADGALAALTHANFVQTLLPEGATLKVLSDAGFFSLNDTPPASLLELHNISEAIPLACREQHSGSLSLCYRAEVIYSFVTPPIFVVNSQYDNVALRCTPRDCHAEANVTVHKENFDRQIAPVLSSRSQNGYFLSSCLLHCQALSANYIWYKISINGFSLPKTVGDWYFERSSNTRIRDCETVSCNPSCPLGQAIPTTASESGAISYRASPYLLIVLHVIILGLWN